MKNFCRSDQEFSLCGLNCGLCPMKLDNYCPGCGGGPGNQPCAIARCSQQHGNVEYCYLCGRYLCEKYDGIDKYDLFITHRNQIKDNERVRNIGIDAYRAELAEKTDILKICLQTSTMGGARAFSS